MNFFNLFLSLLLLLLISQTPAADSPLRYLAPPAENYRQLYEEEKRENENLAIQLRQLTENLNQASLKTSPSKPKANFNYSGDDIFKLVNDYRRQANVGDLSPDPNLCFLASLRLSQLLELGRLDSHQGFIDFNPTEKFKYQRVGENLAAGYATAQEVVEAWEKSPGHNLTLKDPVNSLGCVASNRGFSVFTAGREN